MTVFFFFNDTATTEIYTLSLHDALPIFRRVHRHGRRLLERDRGRVDAERQPRHVAAQPEAHVGVALGADDAVGGRRDRKSTRLNSSHANISYAVFCLKKKTIQNSTVTTV